MQKQDRNQTTVKVQFEDIELTVKPDNSHEWLLETSLVAKGYEIDSDHIKKSLKRRKTDLIEGKHFIRQKQLGDNCSLKGRPTEIFWTKRGVVRLGFFLRSGKAKQFRDWAEDLIIESTAPNKGAYYKDLLEKSFKVSEALVSDNENLRLKIEEDKLMTIGEFIDYHERTATLNVRFEIGLHCRMRCDELGIEPTYRHSFKYNKENIYPQSVIMEIVNERLRKNRVPEIEYKIEDEKRKIS